MNARESSENHTGILVKILFSFCFPISLGIKWNKIQKWINWFGFRSKSFIVQYIKKELWMCTCCWTFTGNFFSTSFHLHISFPSWPCVSLCDQKQQYVSCLVWRKKRGDGWDVRPRSILDYPPAKHPSSSTFSLGTASHALVTPELLNSVKEARAVLPSSKVKITDRCKWSLCRPWSK